MDLFKNNSSLISGEEDCVFNGDNTLAQNETIEPTELLEIKEERAEYLETTYFEKKDDGSKTDVHIKTEDIELGTSTKDYENWEGRIVFTDKDVIRARLINTQRIYSPRIIQISKSVFIANGILKDLNVGDIFELTFKHVKIQFKTKEEKFGQREENIDTIRLVEQIRLTRSEIDMLVSKELQALSYLFK